MEELQKKILEQLLEEDLQFRKQFEAQEDYRWHDLMEDEEKKRDEIKKMCEGGEYEWDDPMGNEEKQHDEGDGWECSCGLQCGEKQRSCACGEARRNMRTRTGTGKPPEPSFEHPYQADSICEAKYWYASHRVVHLQLLLCTIAFTQERLVARQSDGAKQEERRNWYECELCVWMWGWGEVGVEQHIYAFAAPIHRVGQWPSIQEMEYREAEGLTKGQDCDH